MIERPGCVGTEDLIPELAFGVASGDDRARALRHLAHCAVCRGELESVTALADGLLLLAPEREPPPEFESRVMSAAAVLPKVTRRRKPYGWLRTVLVGAAAAAMIVAATAGAVWWRTADDRELAADYRQTLAVAHGRYLRAAPMLAEGAAPAGHIFAYQGSPSWIFVVVKNAAEAAPTATYAVRLRMRDGRRMRLGTMMVEEGNGSWSMTIAMSVSQIVAIELTGPDDRKMTASLGYTRA